MATSENILKDALGTVADATSQKTFSIANRQREKRGSRLRLYILRINLGAKSGTIKNLHQGEYIDFHYFPTEVKESVAQKYDFKGGPTQIRETVTWLGPSSRKISFTGFFNEWGDNENLFKEKIKSEKREGIRDVSDSLHFLRQVTSPVPVISGDKEFGVAPPLLGLVGLFPNEVFICNLTSLGINVLKWIPQNNVVSLKDPFGLTGTSFLTDVSVSGYGKKPIRANVDFEFTENRNPSESSNQNK